MGLRLSYEKNFNKKLVFNRVYLQPQSLGSSHHLTVRPLARKDVFYTGSIYHLQVDAEPEPQHRQGANVINTFS